MSNPYPREADMLCSTLVKEILHPRSWSDIQDVVYAIRNIRQQEKSRASEWEHLNSDSDTNSS